MPLVERVPGRFSELEQLGTRAPRPCTASSDRSPGGLAIGESAAVSSVNLRIYPYANRITRSPAVAGLDGAVGDGVLTP